MLHSKHPRTHRVSKENCLLRAKIRPRQRSSRPAVQHNVQPTVAASLTRPAAPSSNPLKFFSSSPTSSSSTRSIETRPALLAGMRQARALKVSAETTPAQTRREIMEGERGATRP